MCGCSANLNIISLNALVRRSDLNYFGLDVILLKSDK